MFHASAGPTEKETHGIDGAPRIARGPAQSPVVRFLDMPPRSRIPPVVLVLGVLLVGALLVLSAQGVSLVSAVRLLGEGVFQFLQDYHIIRVDDPLPREAHSLERTRRALGAEAPEASTTAWTAIDSESWQEVVASLPENLRSMDPAEWEGIHREVRRTSAMADSLRNGALSLTGIDLAYLGKPTAALSVDARRLRSEVKEHCLEAKRLMESGRSDEALEEAAAAVRAAQRYPIADIDAVLAGMKGLNEGVEVWRDIAASVTDPVVLKAALVDMNTAAMRLGDLLSQMPSPLRRALVAHLLAVGPEASRELLGAVNPGVLIDGVAQAEEKALADEASRANGDSPPGQGQESARSHRLRNLVLLLVDARRSDPPVKTSDPRVQRVWHPVTSLERCGQTRLDLLRLVTALRLRALQGGSEVESLENLAPRYVPLAPLDPFSQNGYRFLPDRRAPYSVGPDGADDQAEIVYDATNGTMSRGDVLLDPEGALPDGSRAFSLAGESPGH